MKAKFILSLILTHCVVYGFSQEILLIENRTTVYEKGDAGTKKTVSASYAYDFKIDNGTKQSIGKYGKNLRPHIKDEAALKLFDKSMRQAKVNNNLIYVSLLGAGALVGGFVKGVTETTAEGESKNFFNAITISGGVILISNMVARSVLSYKVKDNLKNSVKMNNKKYAFLNLTPDNIGLGWGGKSNGLRMNVAWKF